MNNRLFSIIGYHVSSRRNGSRRRGTKMCEASVKVKIPGAGNKKPVIKHTVSDGDEPVNALDIALRLALAKAFPQIENVDLVGYSLTIFDGNRGTAAKTRIKITLTDGKNSWTTVGIDENIIEASLAALEKGYRRKLEGG